MSNFITYREKNEEGNLLYYILQRSFPHYEAVLLLNPRPGALAQTPIAGYHLWVTVIGTLRGGMIPSYKNVVEEMQVISNEMAFFYLNERIMPDEKKYKKWRINVSGTN